MPATGSASDRRDPARTARSHRALALAALLAVALGVYGVLAVARRHAPDDPLHGDSDEASAAMAQLVAATEPSRLLPRLLALSDDPNAATRSAAIDALGQMRDPRASERVAAAFRDSASIVRQRAMEVLPELDRTRGLQVMLSALRDEDTWIRDAAAQQFVTRSGRKGSVVDRRAVPALIAALDDRTSPAVPLLAIAALRRLTGQPWRYRAIGPPAEKQAAVARWKAWWAARAASWRIPPEYAHPPVLYPTRADPAADFALKDTDGRPVELGRQKGRITLLNFWGTWCPTCRQEVSDLAAIDRAYRARGVDVVGIALSESNGVAGLRKWCSEHGVAYRQCLSTPQIQEAYGHIHEVPVSVLIDREGRIRYRWEGERDLPTFRAAVERLLGPSG